MRYKSSAAFYELLFGVARRFRPTETRRDRREREEGGGKELPAFCKHTSYE